MQLIICRSFYFCYMLYILHKVNAAPSCKTRRCCKKRKIRIGRCAYAGASTPLTYNLKIKRAALSAVDNQRNRMNTDIVLPCA